MSEGGLIRFFLKGYTISDIYNASSAIIFYAKGAMFGVEIMIILSSSRTVPTIPKFII